MGARRKQLTGQHTTAKTRRTIANNTMSVSKSKAASDKTYLEQENVTTTEDNQHVDLTNAAPQEPPRSEAADARPPIETTKTPEQTEPEVTTPPVDKAAQPTPPRAPGKSVITRILPERQTPEPLVAAEPSEAPPSLADLDWMPPAENQVARFLNDVADIEPPPVREREGNRVPGFMLPSATSPEAVQRKKAKTEPFWSQVVATPMEQRASSPASAISRRGGRIRLRGSTRWLVVVGIILLLVIIGLAAAIVTHPGLLSGKVHL